MRAQVNDSFNELAYYSLFDIAERSRWFMTALPWDSFDASKCTPELISTVKTMTLGECTTFSATRAFMDLFVDDLDFTQWLAVWLYEETKHPQALVKWLSVAGEKVPGQHLLDAREITPMTQSKVEMLTFNIVSEIVAAALYLNVAKTVEEPLLKEILLRLGKDEQRHSIGFEHYCKDYIKNAEDPISEKLRCLRSAWVFLQDEAFVQHPVYITLHRLKHIVSEDTMTKIREQLTSRISKAIEIPIDSPDELYGVYKEMKKEYQKKQTQMASMAVV
jgi:rubrerythrin